jgi:hypothetical protein
MLGKRNKQMPQLSTILNRNLTLQVEQDLDETLIYFVMGGKKVAMMFFEEFLEHAMDYDANEFQLDFSFKRED